MQNRTSTPLIRLFLFATAALTTSAATADEGMWPYNMAPVDEVKSGYGFEMTDAWLQHVMRSSVRFNNGGSGSFVSKDGLVMTNHHVGADCIQKLAAVEGADDFIKNGFLAADGADEGKCPGLELNRLEEITDVTGAVEGAAAVAKSDADKNAARKAKMAELEKACSTESGGRCDVVTLYSGGVYNLYRYTKFTDVRLVFAPEMPIAFFGGDPDNFTYPRHCLDVAFFRVYQDDKPVAVADHLPFSPTGAKAGELVFVSGNPGSTGRFTTLSELKMLRETTYPFILDGLGKKRDRLKAFMDKGDAELRAARDDFFGAENALKALGGYLEGLKDAELMDTVAKRTADVTAKLQSLPAAERNKILEAWPKLDAAYADYQSFYKEYSVTERHLAPSGTLVSVAKTLVRLSAELSRPSEKRLREFRDSNLKSVEHHLFSDAPIFAPYQELLIAFGLEQMSANLGARDKNVVAALGGKTPAAAAAAAVAGTKLADVVVRKELLEKVRAAIAAAGDNENRRAAAAAKVLDENGDTMIAFVRTYEPRGRKLRRRYEDGVQSVERTYKGRIAQAWAKAFGQSVYPDATFTLRLNHGVVKGVITDGKKLSWRTQFGDLYRTHKRARGQEPYALPERWLSARSRVDFGTPFNFISTNDIIGGNSGSPVLNRAGEVVGLVFDGNLAMLPNRFLYRDTHSRAVNVHGAAILHALDVVYGAKALHQELLGAH